MQGNFGEEDQVLTRALQLAESTDNSFMRGHILTNRVRWLCETGADLDGAELVAHQALAQAAASNAPYLRLCSHTALADVYRRMGNADNAVENIREALRIVRAVGSPWPLAEVLLTVARINHTIGAEEVAVENLVEMESLLDVDSDHDLRSQLLLLRGELVQSARRSDWEQALVEADKAQAYWAVDIRQRLTHSSE